MLRVCIDSNVYISAVAFDGKPNLIIDMALDKKFHLITSSAILNEVERNLLGKMKVDVNKVETFLDDILEVASIFEPIGQIKLIPHPKDTLVLETAILGKADILVTGDKRDLLTLKVFQGVEIEPPSVFLMRFQHDNN